MNWNNGFSARYYVAVVDPASWGDIDRFDITGGSIDRTDSGLRQSAALTCVNRRPSREQWIRVYLEARQSGSSEREALFTGLAISPERQIDGSVETNPLDCFSVLKAADDVLLQRGWYAPANSPGAELAKKLLEATPAPVTIEGVSPRLTNHIIAEEKETHLTMADKILDAIGWRMRISGDGRITLCPQAEEPIWTFDALENDTIEPQVTYKDDWYSCPNVLRVTMGDLSAIARDDSPTGMLSTAVRGREVWAEESNCNLNDSESLGMYAIRRLKELQSHAVNINYARRYNPIILVTDKIRLNYPNPRYDLVGVFTIKSQNITLGSGARTTEEVEAE